MVYPAALCINLLNPHTYRSYAAHPERLYDLVKGNPDKKIIVIYEIQRVSELLSVIHDLIESHNNPSIQFVLTGSSARKLKETGVNLLAGRVLKKTLHPFMASELGSDFSLERALLQGMIPLIHKEGENWYETMHAYINLYVKEEVMMEGLVRQEDSFFRFLEVISFSYASPLNVMNITRECAVKRKAVENYLSILDDLMLSFTVPVFSNRAKRELIAHPKFYLFDVGVFYGLRPRGILDSTTEIEGLALEGLVAQHLRAWKDYVNAGDTLYFWRTRSGLEVDFVMYGPSGFWAIEVKNGKSIDRQDLKGLRQFKADYPDVTPLFLYRGTEKIEIEGILCLPCDTFLRALTPKMHKLIL